MDPLCKVDIFRDHLGTSLKVLPWHGSRGSISDGEVKGVLDNAQAPGHKVLGVSKSIIFDDKQKTRVNLTKIQQILFAKYILYI